MKKTILVVVLLLVSVSLLAPVALGEDLLEKGDGYLREEEYSKAQEVFERALETEPENSELLWRLAKVQLRIGDEALEEEKLDIYRKGEEYAERAIELDPQSPDAHYWYASLLGRIGQTRGVLQSLFMVSPMQEALEQVLEIDPQYAGAYYVLSMLYMEAPGWPLSIGDLDQSLEYALKSVEMEPDNLDHNYNLVEVYLEKNKTVEAEKIIRDMLAHPEIDDHPEMKAELEKLIN